MPCIAPTSLIEQTTGTTEGRAWSAENIASSKKMSLNWSLRRLVSSACFSLFDAGCSLFVFLFGYHLRQVLVYPPVSTGSCHNLMRPLLVTPFEAPVARSLSSEPWGFTPWPWHGLSIHGGAPQHGCWSWGYHQSWGLYRGAPFKDKPIDTIHGSIMSFRCCWIYLQRFPTIACKKHPWFCWWTTIVAVD